MCATPYQTKLHRALDKARAVDDRDTIVLITRMLELVANDRYAELEALFWHLRPIHRIRLGAPPPSRDFDRTS